MATHRLADSAARTLEARLNRLRDPPTYPDRPNLIRVVETSLSWVFLADRFAYKLKKPICHPLVDLRTLEAREANAIEEVRLNRRLAPGVYLGIVPLTEDTSGHLALGGTGRVVDWLLKMRRLPEHSMLDVLLKRRTLPETRLRGLADLLARFYASAPRVTLQGIAYRERLWAELWVNLGILMECRSVLPWERVASLHNRLFRFLQEDAALLAVRAERRYLVEGHGDLRPEHVCLVKTPVVFDCLEFNERLRQLDPLDDLAFLAVGCERLGSEAVGETLYETYREISADRAPERLTHFYSSYRASVRLRLAAAHIPGLRDRAAAHWRDKAASFLGIAERHAARLG
jgi:aminoglycoside phosphotransferase family enzyme